MLSRKLCENEASVALSCVEPKERVCHVHVAERGIVGVDARSADLVPDHVHDEAAPKVLSGLGDSDLFQVRFQEGVVQSGCRVSDDS